MTKREIRKLLKEMGVRSHRMRRFIADIEYEGQKAVERMRREGVTMI